MKKILLAIIFLAVSSGLFVEAKRTPPPVVQPIVYSGVQYVAPYGVIWYIEAYNTTPQEKLWWMKVYTIKYIPGLETDIQDVFITKLAIRDGKLIVSNEDDNQYTINLETKKVEKIEKADWTTEFVNQGKWPINRIKLILFRSLFPLSIGWLL